MHRRFYYQRDYTDYTDYTDFPRDTRDTWRHHLTQIYESQIDFFFLNTNCSDHTNKIALRREFVSSVKSCWLFVSWITGIYAYFFAHRKHGTHRIAICLTLAPCGWRHSVNFVDSVCDIFSCLTRRRKGRKDFYQRDYTDYTVFLRNRRNVWLAGTDVRSVRP